MFKLKDNKNNQMLLTNKVFNKIKKNLLNK